MISVFFSIFEIEIWLTDLKSSMRAHTALCNIHVDVNIEHNVPRTKRTSTGTGATGDILPSTHIVSTYCQPTENP